VLSLTGPHKLVIYYESRKRELKRRLVYEGRCDERLKAKFGGVSQQKNAELLSNIRNVAKHHQI